jgi:hypothetical protein
MSSMTFFEGWNTLISGHETGEVVLWNEATGSHLVIGQHNNTVACMEMGIVYVCYLAHLLLLAFWNQQLPIELACDAERSRAPRHWEL